MSETRKTAPRWAWWVATGLGSGRLRPAPGTWGSLAGLGVWCAFAWVVTGQASARSVVVESLFLLAIGLLAWLSVRASDLVVQETGREDPGYIVADEWVGMWVTLWPLRWETHRLFAPRGWLLLVVPFLVFRLLDIWKPWPVHQLQDLPGGQGIVADDLVAGLYGLPIVILLTPWVIVWASL